MTVTRFHLTLFITFNDPWIVECLLKSPLSDNIAVGLILIHFLLIYYIQRGGGGTNIKCKD